MKDFNGIIQAPSGERLTLQGNLAFALGVVHAGYHAADGYPGTPSTEVISKALIHARDYIQAGWSINEATAVATGVGRAIAGYDTVITMKVPGVFQAADVISTAAFYPAPRGALTIYVVTDYEPSSTQHLVDPRPFFRSCRLPIIEPADHQALYEAAGAAAGISKKFGTPVVVLASGPLAHSEGIIRVQKARVVKPQYAPKQFSDWMILPEIARINYEKAGQERIPRIINWLPDSGLIHELGQGPKDDAWGIITVGANLLAIKEVLHAVKRSPHILSLGISYPVAVDRVRQFCRQAKGKFFIFENGDNFLQNYLAGEGINIIGKSERDNIARWTPEAVLAKLTSAGVVERCGSRAVSADIQPVQRPPTICAGCPYRALGLVVDKMKQQGKILASFGDIGCSTLLYYLNALDTVLCMGASDAIRQGYVLSRPDTADRVISIIGDSSECHSGLAATRNGVYKNISGVKIVLDNMTTAMTGGQPTPTSAHDGIGDVKNRFDLGRAERAEGAETMKVDPFNAADVEKCLHEALARAGRGRYSVLILRGDCIRNKKNDSPAFRPRIDYKKCTACGLCNICPGIKQDDNQRPIITELCNSCGGHLFVCAQRCPAHAISTVHPEKESKKYKDLSVKHRKSVVIHASGGAIIKKIKFPREFRMAMRGVGGQGNIFLNKVLSRVVFLSSARRINIISGNTPGMAQWGGPVMSTFGFGNVYAPSFLPGSADILVALEAGEILRPDFLSLLKAGGIILLNKQTIEPRHSGHADDYADMNRIAAYLKKQHYRFYLLGLKDAAQEIGDWRGKFINSIMLGVISSINPFSGVAENFWHQALADLAGGDDAERANMLAFHQGRLWRQKHKIHVNEK